MARGGYLFRSLWPVSQNLSICHPLFFQIHGTLQIPITLIQEVSNSAIIFSGEATERETGGGTGTQPLQCPAGYQLLNTGQGYRCIGKGQWPVFLKEE